MKTKTRYATYSRPIPSLGREHADLTGTAKAATLAFPGTPHRVLPRPSVLETRHPEVIHAITLLWGYPEMNQYFEKLWLDDGRGHPLEPEAMSELMLLAGVHRWLAPQRPVRSMASIYDASHSLSRPSNVWSDASRRR
jgi:hypothetical protein